MFSLDSPCLPTRKRVVNVLSFLCYCDYLTGHQLILKGFDELREARGFLYHFGPWLDSLNQTIEDHCIMGTMVNASEEYKALGGNRELMEHVLGNVILVNMLVSTCEDLETRVFLCTQFHSADFS